MESRNIENRFRFCLQAAGLGQSDGFNLETIGYFEAPASKSHHLNRKGGLVEHSVNVAEKLAAMSEALDVPWLRPESPYLVGLLHDLIKCQCYIAEKAEAVGVKWNYVQPEFPGHGIGSSLIAQALGIQLNEPEVMAIVYHMGTFNIGKEYRKEEFEKALGKYGEFILATHAADWYASIQEGKAGCGG